MSSVSFLPQAYLDGSQGVLFRSLLETFDYHIQSIYDWYDYYEMNLLNPNNVSDSTLDLIGLASISPWRHSNLWNRNWNPTIKRELLRNEETIFTRRLYPETIQLLFECFKLRSRLEPKNGWILGATTPPATVLPATLGTSIFDYRIILPLSYTEGTQELEYTKWIVANFGIPSQPEFVTRDI